MTRKKIQIDHNKVVQMIANGYTQIQIGKELGIGKNTIINYLKENNLKTKSRYENLVGNKFGKLKVLEQVENSKDRRRRYLCQCECGNQTIVKSKYLNNGETRSCGCYKDMENYKLNNYKEAIKKIGHKYGKLTIIDVELNQSRGKYMMICKCECGSISNKCYTKMKQGKTISCGCHAKEMASKRQSKNSYQKERWYFIRDNKKIYCRSSYEVIFANYLIINNIDFEYEPTCFKLENGKRYTPDFYINNECKYIEVKGINYNTYDRSNQREKFDIFKQSHNIELYYWNDLIETCGLPYKNYSSYKNRADKMNITIENYFSRMLYN
ncbi:MAG: hypothetical protein RR942_09235 [Romboutsia sp.]